MRPVRPARPADRPALRRLQRYLPEPAPELLDPAAGAEVLVSTAGMGEAFDHGTTPDIGADTPVGYLLWLPDTPVYAAELVVSPAYRRQGRGRSLFLALFASLPVGTVVRLQVAADNEGAQSLYRSLGFDVVGRDPDAYESGPGLWMEATVERENE